MASPRDILAQRTAQKIESDALGAIQSFETRTQAPPQTSVLGEIPRGVARGVEQVLSSGGSALRGAGDALGSQTISNLGEDMAGYHKDLSEARVLQTDAPARVEDVQWKSPRSVLKYTAARASEQLPQLAGAAGSAVASTVLTGTPIPGLAAWSGVQEYGSIYQDQLDQNAADPSKPVNNARAALAAIPAAGLDMVGEVIGLGRLGFAGKGVQKLLDKAGGTKVGKFLGDQNYTSKTRAALGEAWRLPAGEIPTETSQTAIERWGANKSLTDADAMSDYLNTAASVMAGMTPLGAVQGAAGHGFRQHTQGQTSGAPAPGAAPVTPGTAPMPGTPAAQQHGPAGQAARQTVAEVMAENPDIAAILTRNNPADTTDVPLNPAGEPLTPATPAATLTPGAPVAPAPDLAAQVEAALQAKYDAYEQTKPPETVFNGTKEVANPLFMDWQIRGRTYADYFTKLANRETREQAAAELAPMFKLGQETVAAEPTTQEPVEPAPQETQTEGGDTTWQNPNPSPAEGVKNAEATQPTESVNIIQPGVEQTPAVSAAQEPLNKKDVAGFLSALGLVPEAKMPLRQYAPGFKGTKEFINTWFKGVVGSGWIDEGQYVITHVTKTQAEKLRVKAEAAGLPVTVGPANQSVNTIKDGKSEHRYANVPGKFVVRIGEKATATTQETIDTSLPETQPTPEPTTPIAVGALTMPRNAAVKGLGDLVRGISNAFAALTNSESLVNHPLYDRSFPIPREGGLQMARNSEKYKTDAKYREKVDNLLSEFYDHILTLNRQKTIIEEALGKTAPTEYFMATYKANPTKMWVMAAKRQYPDEAYLGNISVREALQNSLDAVAKAIKNKEIKANSGLISISTTSESYQIEDNGVGMDADTIENKFLSLGESGKEGDPDAQGGFGIAKAVILMPHEKAEWKLLTQDNEFTSQMALDDEPIGGASYKRQGTKLRVTATEQIISDKAKQYVALTELPKGIAVKYNGDKLEYPFKGLRAIKSSYTMSRRGSGSDTTINLAYYPAKGQGYPGEYDGQLVIRLLNPNTGIMLAQSIRGIGGTGFHGTIVADVTTTVDPKDDDYPLVASRMDFQWWARSGIQELVEKYTIDNVGSGATAEPLRKYMFEIPAWKAAVAGVAKNRTYLELMGYIKQVQAETKDFFGYARPMTTPAMYEMVFQKGKLPSPKQGPLAATAAYEGLMRLYAGSQGITIREMKIGADSEVNASYAPGGYCTFNPFNISKATMEDPLRLGMYLHDLATHELTHETHGYHNEAYSSQREQNARMFSAMLPHAIKMGEILTGKTIVSLRTNTQVVTKTEQVPVYVDREVVKTETRTILTPKEPQLEFDFMTEEEPADANIELYHPDEGNNEGDGLFSGRYDQSLVVPPGTQRSPADRSGGEQQDIQVTPERSDGSVQPGGQLRAEQPTGIDATVESNIEPRSTLSSAPETRYSQEGVTIESDKLDAHHENILIGMGHIVEKLDGIVKIHVLRSLSQVGLNPAYPAAYQDGRIYLASDKIQSVEHAQNLVLDHELRHHGLRGILGDRFHTVMQQIWFGNTEKIRKFARSLDINITTLDGRLEATEEYIVAQARSAEKHRTLDRIVTAFRTAIRRLGFTIRYSDAEIRDLVARSGEAKEMVTGGEARYSRVPNAAHFAVPKSIVGGIKNIINASEDGKYRLVKMAESITDGELERVPQVVWNAIDTAYDMTGKIAESRARIEAKYANRPDKVAHLIQRNEKQWRLTLLANYVVDSVIPNERAALYSRPTPDVRYAMTPQDLHDMDVKELNSWGYLMSHTFWPKVNKVLRALQPEDRLLGWAKGFSEYHPIIKALEDLHALKNAMQQRMDRVFGDGERRRKATRDVLKNDTDKKNYNTLDAQATLFQIWPGQDIATQPWTDAQWRQKGFRRDLTLQEAQDHIDGLWNELNLAQQAQWHENQRFMKELGNEVRDAMKGQIMRTTVETTPATATKWKDHLHRFGSIQQDRQGWKFVTNSGRVSLRAPTQADLQARLTPWGERERLVEIIEKKFRSKGPYSPLSRWGDALVDVWKRDANADLERGERVGFWSFESAADAQAFSDRAVAEGYVTRNRGREQSSYKLAGVPSELMHRMEAMYDSMTHLSDTDKQQMKEQFAAIWMSLGPENSALKHDLHRKGILGFDTDMMRSMLGYSSKMGNLIAKLTHGGAISEKYKDISATIKEKEDEAAVLMSSVDPAERAIGQQMNVTEMRNLLNDLQARDQKIASARSNPAVAAATQIASFWYLASPSLALVQTAQPFIFAVPKIGSIHGFAAAAAAISKHYTRQLTKTGGELTYSENRLEPWRKLANQIIDAEDAGDTAQASLLWRGATTDEERMMLGMKVAVARNAITITMTHDAHDVLVSGSESKTQKFMNSAMIFMRTSEIASRKATFAAAFELEYAKLRGEYINAHGSTYSGTVAPPAGYTARYTQSEAAELATKYSIKVVDDALFKYDTFNRNPMLTTPWGKLFLQFRIFQFHSLWKMANMAMEATNYRTGTPAERALVRKELAGLVGSTLLLSGVQGLPVIAPVIFALSKLLTAMFGDDGDDPMDLEMEFAQWSREGLAQTVAAKGIFALLGADISNRVGVNTDFIQGHPPESAKAREQFAWYCAKLAGPFFGGVVQDVAFTGREAVKNGDWAGALQAATPKGLRDFSKAYQATFGEGVKTASGKLLVPPDQLGIHETIMMLVGINPTQVSLARENQAQVQQISDRLNNEKQLITRHFVNAIASDDSDAREKALEDIRNFNEHNPGLGFRGSELSGAILTAMKKASGMDTKRESLIKRTVMDTEG